MIALPGRCAEAIARSAEASYPEECCGLLIGTRGDGGAVSVTEAIASRNVAPPPRRDRFEVDPALRLSLMRRLRGTSEDIVGHFHSHPDAPAWPSARDAEMAFEPELLWLLVPVAAGRAGAIRAFRWAPEAGRFVAEPLRVEPGAEGTPGDEPWDEKGRAE